MAPELEVRIHTLPLEAYSLYRTEGLSSPEQDMQGSDGGGTEQQGELTLARAA